MKNEIKININVITVEIFNTFEWNLVIRWSLKLEHTIVEIPLMHTTVNDNDINNLQMICPIF